MSLPTDDFETFVRECEAFWQSMEDSHRAALERWPGDPVFTRLAERARERRLNTRSELESAWNNAS